MGDTRWRGAKVVAHDTVAKGLHHSIHKCRGRLTCARAREPKHDEAMTKGVHAQTHNVKRKK